MTDKEGWIISNLSAALFARPPPHFSIALHIQAGTTRIINFTRLFGGNIRMCTPSLALHMIEKAPGITGDQKLYEK